MSKLAEVKLIGDVLGVKKREEHLCAFTFPEWSKEQYLDFVREWKETYKNHSEHARLEKRYRKTVHNVITPKEEARYDETGQHTSYEPETFYNGRNIGGTFFTHDNKGRARFLIAIRRAGKNWSAVKRVTRTDWVASLDYGEAPPRPHKAA